jgi:Histone methylation protein DOT1
MVSWMSSFFKRKGMKDVHDAIEAMKVLKTEPKSVDKRSVDKRRKILREGEENKTIDAQLTLAYTEANIYAQQGMNWGPIYGELAVGSFDKVIKFLIKNCNMNENTRFIDVGSGMGKPNLHIAITSKVLLSLGVECEILRYQLCMTILQQISKVNRPYRTFFQHLDIFNAASFVSFIF